jgi:signal transduction histidine kinase
MNVLPQVQLVSLHANQAVESINQWTLLMKQVTRTVRDHAEESVVLSTITELCLLNLALSRLEISVYNLDQSLVSASYVATWNDSSKLSFSMQRDDYPQGMSPRFLLQPRQMCSSLVEAESVTHLQLPIVDLNGTMGEVTASRSALESFSEQEIAILEQVADHCAIALRRNRIAQLAQTQSIELKRLNQVQDNFLSTVSYELRIPLANIRMAIQMVSLALKREETESSLVSEAFFSLSPEAFDKVTRYIAVLQKECDRETKLIQDLLDLQQLDTDTLSLIMSVIQLDQWLPYIVNPFHKRFQEYQLTCSVEIEPDLPSLMCDQINLSRILVELLNNAYRYTPTGEKITVTAKKAPSSQDPEQIMFHLQVTNSGVELPPEEIPRIFDKFYRIPKLDLRKQGGTGLGLALVQKLVTRLGGQILVASSQGATSFTVELPFQGVRH